MHAILNAILDCMIIFLCRSPYHNFDFFMSLQIKWSGLFYVIDNKIILIIIAIVDCTIWITRVIVVCKIKIILVMWEPKTPKFRVFAIGKQTQSVITYFSNLSYSFKNISAKWHVQKLSCHLCLSRSLLCNSETWVITSSKS